MGMTGLFDASEGVSDIIEVKLWGLRPDDKPPVTPVSPPNIVVPDIDGEWLKN